MPTNYTKSARAQSAAAREPSAADAPTLNAAVHAVLADELYCLRSWAADETLDADMRADAATRIPGVERLDATVMEDATTWAHPLAWHEAIYMEFLLAGYGVYSSAEAAIDLSYLDEATARKHYERALEVLARHDANSR